MVDYLFLSRYIARTQAHIDAGSVASQKKMNYRYSDADLGYRITY